MCAYNPGVQNISGQIMAQGINNASQSIAQAIQQYQQNKHMAGQAIAQFEGAASSNPDMLQYLSSEQANPEIKSAFSKLQKGGAVGFKDAAALATFANSYQANKSAQAERKDAEEIKKLFSTFQKTGDLQQALAGFNGSPRALQQIDGVLQQFAPRAPQNAFDPVSVRETGPNGEPIEVTYDKKTGRKLAQGPVGQNKYVLTPEEQVQVAGQTESVKEDAKRASEFVTGIADAAEGAQAIVPQIKRIRELYEAGAKSGFGQDFINSAGSFAVQLGLGDPNKQANQEELQKLLANSALTTAQQLMKGTGTVSNYERELVNKASAEVGKTPAANLRIIKLTEALSERSLAAEIERQKLVDDGKSTSQIAESLRRWRTKNPLDSFMPKEEKGPSVEDLVNKYLKK